MEIKTDLIKEMVCGKCKYFQTGECKHISKMNGSAVEQITDPENPACSIWESKEFTEIEKASNELREAHKRIVGILKVYSDIKEDYYDLVATWIIGTYIYEKFETYPYLFINAMRGSGKTRLLKLIKSIAHNGELVTSLREAVLFRTARGTTLCIDEFESIHKKENVGLRELLNACYKKGMKVKRMKRVKKPTGDEQVVEEFEPYTPIAMANIWGMEEVLGDRCITLILEKSRSNRISRIIEDFDDLMEIKVVKSSLDAILVQLCSYISVKRYMEEWNKWVNQRCKFTTTLTTQTTQTALTTLQIQEMETLFSRIWDTEINGRNLELMFPLIIIAKYTSEDILSKILRIATEMTKEKKEEEMIESRDIGLAEFVSNLSSMEEFISVKSLTYKFREYLGDDDEDDRWLNNKWVGKSLKRLNLIIDKRRIANGVEVRLDISKATELVNHIKSKK